MKSKGQGWITARPLEKYSSLHTFSITSWLGLGDVWLKPYVFIEFDFNLHTPFKRDPNAYLAFQTQDANKPIAPDCCFSITNLTRWRVDISSFSSFDEFLGSLIRWHRCNYIKSQKTFKDYGCTVTLIDRDWSEHVETVYRLYCNVARAHGDKLYDICFFRDLAKRNDNRLLCAWFEGKIICMFVLQKEPPTIHSICCGMDYEHSSACYAYSWLHYELIRLAIDAKEYHHVDVGLTADAAKREICFTSIPSRMDIYAKGAIMHSLLRLLSVVVTATITSDAKLKLKLRSPFKSNAR